MTIGRFTQQNFRDKLRRICGVDITDDGFDNTGVDLLLNQSLWEIADMFKFREAETDYTNSSVIGTAAIAVQADLNGLQKVSIEDANSSQHTTLDEMSLQDYETDYVDSSTAQGKPTHFVRRGSNIILWPTPDAVYEIKSYYRKTVADMTSGGLVTPQAWDEVILFGGVWRGFVELGDFNRKREAKETQMELLSTKETNETKEKVNRPFAGLQMMRPPYP